MKREGERDGEKLRTSEGVVGHTEEGEAVGSEYVEYVTVLGETEPRIGLRRQLLQYPPRHGAGVPRHGAELRQHRRPPRHHRVQNCHSPRDFRIWLSLSILSSIGEGWTWRDRCEFWGFSMYTATQGFRERERER